MAINATGTSILRGLFGPVAVATLLATLGGCARFEKRVECEDNLRDPCTVSWSPESGRARLAYVRAKGPDKAEPYLVNFGSEAPGGAAASSGTYAVLCGLEDGSSGGATFYLTPENAAGGQQPRYPDAPGLTFTSGWSFITFTWPLIWTRNIDAGSIGTTAIGRWEGMDFSLYLVRNGKPSPGYAGPPVPDTESGLWIETGQWGQFTLTMPEGKEVARVHFTKERLGANLIPVTNGIGQWVVESFDTATDGTGAITVTSGGTPEERAFLADVLNRARAEQIYELPLDPSVPQPEVVPTETF